MKNIQDIIIGGGCFWCLEAIFQRIKGVESVQSGYAGGQTANPTYRDICTGRTGHAEVIKIKYDAEIITENEVLKLFFLFHDPTTLNRQGNDVGTQYRSIIFYKDEAHKERIEFFIKEEIESIWQNPIVTEITEEVEFFPAEDYHDDYYNRNSQQGYCQFVINPKVQKLRAEFSHLLK